MFVNFLRLIMLCLKQLGAISAGVSLIRQAGNLASGNGHLFRRNLNQLMHTSAAVSHHPRHQHVILDTETEMDRYVIWSKLYGIIKQEAITDPAWCRHTCYIVLWYTGNSILFQKLLYGLIMAYAISCINRQLIIIYF